MPANDAEHGSDGDHDDGDNDNNNSNNGKMASTDIGTSEDRKKWALNNNPLLDGGMLVRPIWEPPEGEKGKGVEVTFRQSKWRRVQDDQEDARWILNGGLHGHEDDNKHRMDSLDGFKDK
jgi:hypothetical protein